MEHMVVNEYALSRMAQLNHVDIYGAMEILLNIVDT
jgi:hypothetical protein